MTNAVAPLNAIPLAAPSGTEEQQCAKVYRLRKCTAAVQFDATGKGLIVVLPEGVELLLTGPSSLLKCFEVVCRNERYSMFQEDLLGPWSTPIKNGRSGAMRVRAVEACA